MNRSFRLALAVAALFLSSRSLIAAPVVLRDDTDSEQRLLAREPGALAREATKAIYRKDVQALRGVLDVGFDPDTHFRYDGLIPNERTLLVSASEAGFVAGESGSCSTGAPTSMSACTVRSWKA